MIEHAEQEYAKKACYTLSFKLAPLILNMQTIFSLSREKKDYEKGKGSSHFDCIS
jgi:hypothetical protein